METRISPQEMESNLAAILRADGFTASDAATCARIFTDNTADGVASHGINRFSSFVQRYRDGVMHPDRRPELVSSFGAFERWDGKSGVGPLNALHCTDRAVDLAGRHGVGAVALRNNTHWMRGGTYGWRAADRGCAFLCWTNTKPNMPPWGVSAAVIGNNPLIVSVPRPGGHVVLDMAMSQFSFGKLETLVREGGKLPVPGGFDASGAPTTDPAAILEAGRPAPIGFWKGSGLSVVLDMIAATLSGGLATHQIDVDEGSVSQFFLAIDLATIGAGDDAERTVDAVVSDLAKHGAAYPGGGTLERRNDARNGIPVNVDVWAEVLKLRDCADPEE